MNWDFLGVEQAVYVLNMGFISYDALLWISGQLFLLGLLNFMFLYILDVSVDIEIFLTIPCKLRRVLGPIWLKSEFVQRGDKQKLSYPNTSFSKRSIYVNSIYFDYY